MKFWKDICPLTHESGQGFMLWQQIAPWWKTTREVYGKKLNTDLKLHKTQKEKKKKVEISSVVCSQQSVVSENMTRKIPADKSGSRVELNNI